MIQRILSLVVLALYIGEVPGWGQSPLTMKILPSDARPGQNFGFSIAVDDPLMVVGAYRDSAVASEAGSVYVFEREGDRWVQQIRLEKETPVADDLFGYDVATDGETIAVSAIRDTTEGMRLGAVYIYRRVAGVWGLQQQLLPSNRLQEGDFGWSLAIIGDTLMVGAPSDGSSGAVYVFEDLAGAWIERAKLAPDDLETGDIFGTPLAVDATTLVVGAAGHNGQQGSAYVFESLGGVWVEQQMLVASDPQIFDRFGDAVAVRGTTIAVGVGKDQVVGSSSGSVYVYDRVGDTWTESQFLTPSDSAPLDVFGIDVAFQGDVLAIGAVHDNHSGVSRAGSVYLFSRPGAMWVEEKKWVAAEPQFNQLFGLELASDGDQLFIGALGDDDAGLGSGAVYGTTSIFADGFESGATSGWASSVP